MTPAISISGLNKSYGAVRALDGFSLEVGEGEFFAFLGRNGAGKTTTINILAGLTTYKDGKVEVRMLQYAVEHKDAFKNP